MKGPEPLGKSGDPRAGGIFLREGGHKKEGSARDKKGIGAKRELQLGGRHAKSPLEKKSARAGGEVDGNKGIIVYRRDGPQGKKGNVDGT